MLHVNVHVHACMFAVCLFVQPPIIYSFFCLDEQTKQSDWSERNDRCTLRVCVHDVLFQSFAFRTVILKLYVLSSQVKSSPIRKSRRVCVPILQISLSVVITTHTNVHTKIIIIIIVIRTV